MILYVDGGCSNNNQLDQSIRTMISAVCDEDGNIVKEVHNHGGSNNLAELIAMEHALDYALENKEKELLIISDSQTAISQFKKDESTRKPKTLLKMNDPEWYQAVKGRIDELKRFINVEMKQVGREDNLAGFYIEEEYVL